MHNLYFVCMGLAFGFLVSCTPNEKPQRPKVTFEKTTSLIAEGENGQYIEWYPGHQQIKVKGRKDEEGRRTGIWKYYSPEGVELSVTVYNKDEKDGHIIVRHPNGLVHYTGEYEMGEPIGLWEFYDEEGNLIQNKDYDNN